MLKQLITEIQQNQNPEKVQNLTRFFKTAKGQYGEGDIFLGLIVPVQRQIAKKYQKLSLKDIQQLLDSKIHEYRLIGLLILTYQYPKADEKQKEAIFNFYLQNTRNINNWDLVDLSTYKIVGQHLKDKDKKILYKLAKSPDLWKKRIAMISCYTFIKNKDFQDALEIAEILLFDKHDLIHKAVGWMLREIGKLDQKVEENFLQKFYQTMPRTCLRYAIEKFDRQKRDFYLGRKI
ncbi:DNA alkylation repair protein [Candidatus Beckwithbacteria bacterium]|nr:DNA alkylation repair protein [Candidatus Beckwithbacteria bacterium]